MRTGTAIGGRSCRRIAEQQEQLGKEIANLERQLAKLRQAMVDDDGLRRFCEIATRNMDGLDDSQWRLLLETMRLTVLVDDSGVTVNVAVPTVNDEKSVIAVGTSRSSCWLRRYWLPDSSGSQLRAAYG